MNSGNFTNVIKGEASSQAYVDRLKSDSNFIRLLGGFLATCDVTDDNLHECLAYFAYQQGFEYDVDALKELLEDAHLNDYIPCNRQPLGDLSQVADPSQIEGVKGKKLGGGGIFDHMYGRIGTRRSRHD